MLAHDGELMFATSPITENVALLVQIAHTLATLVFAGVVFCEVLVVRLRSTPRMLRRVRSAAGVAAIVLAPLLVVTQALRVSGRNLVDVVHPVAWVSAVWWQLAASGVLSVVGIAFALVMLAVRRRGGVPVVAGVAAVLAAAAAASVPVLLGHTQSVEPMWLIQIVDIVHLQVAAFWVGGTCALALYYAGVRAGERGGIATEAAHVTVRFSTIALVTVIVLTVAGVALAVLVFDEPEALVSTSYGRILVVKTVLVLCVGVAAGWNRRRLLPLIERQPNDEAAWAALRYAVLIEAALLVVVVVISGLLSDADPHGHSGVDAAAPAALAVPVRS
ncbi:copper resistance D family protein [Paramicrobacterium chengjingii]|uniref:CopD family protein n=1 Tax=Paramicrobacterium chengjingii TaxID=2769067 RepID=A0ABX6YGU1_9MICO|nr:CopD family protein [Microbacterium chengjingii]QPZ37971.1 CopD family protein [Microbacterium chengjingii]